MTRVLAVDPGFARTAYVVMTTDQAIEEKGIVANSDFVDIVNEFKCDAIAIEMVASYGMPVGREVFETCVWIGRIIERWERATEIPARRLYRRDVKMHLCGSNRASDANIRAALIDHFGPGREKAIGTKKSPGPCFGVSKDIWAALAVAITFMNYKP